MDAGINKRNGCGEKMSDKFYVTTPIYYVNDKPHIGHAYTSIAADTIARYYKIRGRTVKFLTGTDEHGQKVEASAKKLSQEPLEYCDQISEVFRNLSQKLNLSNDDFIRTTEPRHKKAVTRIWSTILENGDIYKSTYKGWYNVSDEAFVPDNEVLEGGFSKDGKKLEFFEEESYFFRLSKWEKPLLDFFEQNPNFIKPAAKYNEVISFVKSGLKDLSISRSSFSWGIPVPGDDRHVIYVWIDALTNYLSAIGYGEGELDQAMWDNVLHLIGKDILKFHAVYWPCILMSAGIKPPHSIFAHGWWAKDGQKISKSLGNTIDPIEVIDTYGLDAFRYFLLREVSFGNDGDFSDQAMKRRLNCDLCNDLGNLVQRTLKLAVKHLGTKIIIDQNYNDSDQEFIQSCENLLQQSETFMEEMQLSKALEAIFAVVTKANQFVENNKPWELAKASKEKLNTVVSILLNTFRQLGFALFPFMPQTMEKLYAIIGLKGFNYNDLKVRQTEYNINEVEILFHKIED